MPRPICVPCAREMTCAKNGYMVHMKTSAEQPYQIWSGDMYECGGCGHQCVVRFAATAVVEHFDEERFNKFLADVDLEVV